MNRLRQYRVAAAYTQTNLAAAIDVSQPTYQRWETGQAPIPKAKAQKLSKILDVPLERLLGTSPVRKASIYSKEAEDLQYYGEVVFHFESNSTPIICSISKLQREKLQDILQEPNPGVAGFIEFQSLGNDLFVVRMAAVSEIYFSDDAYDDFGPEHSDYDLQELNVIEDADQWTAIENYLEGFEGIDAIAEELREIVTTFTVEEVMKLNEGHNMPIDEATSAAEEHNGRVGRIHRQATLTQIQLGNGKRREIHLDDERAYELYERFISFNFGDLMQSIPGNEPYYRDTYMRANAIDYIRIPNHKVMNGMTESMSKELDEQEEFEKRGE